MNNTGLKCCHVGSICIQDAVATIEMKRPYSKTGIFQNPALQPKQQLIGQTLALTQMKLCDYKLSFLTDIFALSVMFHVHGKVNLSRRVTDGKAFCLRLLQMFCNLGDQNWAGLIPADFVARTLTQRSFEQSQSYYSLMQYNSIYNSR